jgi:SAM-dependent methyltransferase
MRAELKYPGLCSQPDHGHGGGLLIQPLKRFLRAQFGRPTGIWGHVAGMMMVRTPSNLDRIRWTLSLLDLRPEDRVLEVGFGPGVAIELLSRIVSNGMVVGVDHSEVMMRQAARRNAEAIRNGRVELHTGSVSALPVFNLPFDKVLTINSIHFWHEPDECLRNLWKLIKPGGRIAVTLQPRSRAATDATARVIGDEVVSKLVLAGFRNCHLELRQTKPVAAVCALGTR